LLCDFFFFFFFWKFNDNPGPFIFVFVLLFLSSKKKKKKKKKKEEEERKSSRPIEKESSSTRGPKVDRDWTNPLMQVNLKHLRKFKDQD
jgi:hypothetical protein